MSSHDSTPEEMRAFINESNSRIATNLRRADNLIDFAENYFPKDSPSPTKDDILRGAVVFLHATLEDFLRYIGCRYIPSGGEDVLNRISLIGSSDRPEKFFLGKLAKHRDRRVDQLIAESVEAHLDKRNFSNTDDIADFLKSVEVPNSVVDKCYRSLSELMTRRHEIVHKGDLKATVNQEDERDPEPIDASKVREWYEAVLQFTNEVVAYRLITGV